MHVQAQTGFHPGQPGSSSSHGPQDGHRPHPGGRTIEGDFERRD
jgi:hypothetical protein